MRTIPIPSRPLGAPIESKRLLALASDERLVARVRRGSDAAFEVLFERHGPGILSFCRHMLGAREEAEDAVQHTFAAAYRALHRDEREIALKAWLYAIARNRCLSLLRARREHAQEEWDLPTEGLAEQVEKRAELRELLRDLQELPEQQRAALLLAEAGGLAHADVAAVLECEVDRVKSLVFQARRGLIRRQQARAIPCVEIREQLATLRGGALRRSELRDHLKDCPGCRAFREQVKHQRAMLAAALPVLPSLKLKTSVLAAVGIGGSAAGGGVAGVVGGTLAKVAIVGAVAGGGAAAGTAIVERSERTPPTDRAVRVQPAEATAARATATATSAAAPVDARRSSSNVRGDEARAPSARGKPARRAGKRRGPKRAAERRASNGRKRAVGRPAEPGARGVKRGQGAHRANRTEPPAPRGRGPVEKPSGSTPVRRGPPDSPPAAGRPVGMARPAVSAAPAGVAPPGPPAHVPRKAIPSKARGRG